MKKAKSWLLLTILMMMLCCTGNCNSAYAQNVSQPQIELNERLPDGSLILTVDGAKYRAIKPEQIRKIQAQKIEQQAALEENAVFVKQTENLNSALKIAAQNEAKADERANLERKRADEFQKLFENEKSLRQQADQILDSKPVKKKSAIKRFFSNRIVQVGIVVVAGTLILRH